MRQNPPISDAQIRAGVNRTLSKHWIDLQPLIIGSYRGVVRLRGELRHHGRHQSDPIRAEQLETIESDLRRLRGVSQVHLHFENWRLDGRKWESIARQEALRREDELATTDLDAENG